LWLKLGMPTSSGYTAEQTFVLYINATTP